MSGKKQFGVWMDTRNATVIGKETQDGDNFVVLGHVINPGAESNSSEKAQNNQEIDLTHKFFKEIAALMQNVDEIHITGTGDSQVYKISCRNSAVQKCGFQRKHIQ